MPQPVKFDPEGPHTHAGWKPTVDPDDFDHELFANAYSIVSSWASIERSQLDIIVDMLGGKRSVATTAYLALDGQGPKSAFINAAAQKCLNPNLNAVLAGIIKASTPLMKYRNKICHWTPSHVPTIKEDLVLLNPETEQKSSSGFNGYYRFSIDEMKKYRRKMTCIG